MVSGSAALPVRRSTAGGRSPATRLLERYGMTEIGMALSNPLAGERRAGTVGPAAARRRGAAGRRRGRARRGRARPARSRCGDRTVFRRYWEPARRDRPAAFHDGLVPDGRRRGGGGRRLSDPGPASVGHHQDRRVQDLGARDRGRPPGASRHRATRPWWACPTPTGASASCAAFVAAGAGGAPIAAALRLGPRASGPLQAAPEIRLVDALPRNAMGKVTKPALRAAFA